MSKKIRAIIVDDEQLARDSVREHLKRHPEIEISGGLADRSPVITKVTCVRNRPLAEVIVE